MSKKTKDRLAKIAIAVVVVLAVVGVYLIKGDPIASNNSTGIYTLDVTWSFDLDEVLSHNLPTIIDFGAETCPPCIEMADDLSSANERYNGKALVKFVDVWENTNGANGFNVTSIPTQYIYDADGNFVERHVGPLTDADFDLIFANLGVELW